MRITIDQFLTKHKKLSLFDVSGCPPDTSSLKNSSHKAGISSFMEILYANERCDSKKGKVNSSADSLDTYYLKW